MNVEYKILLLSEAFKAGYPGLEYYDEQDFDDYDYSFGLWRFENDKPVELLGTDGGEPEDNSFVRDWCWVAKALADAYWLGQQNGMP